MSDYKKRKRIIKHALIALFTVTLLPAVAAHGDEKHYTILGAGEISCRVVLKNPEDKGLRKFYLAEEDLHRGIRKHGCYSMPHNIGPDAAVMFGD